MRRYLWIVSLLLIIGLNSANAQCRTCGGYSTYYNQSYYPVQKIVAQEIAVAPLIVTVPIISQAVPIEAYGVNHYWSAQEHVTQKNMLREIIREELKAFLTQAPVQSVPAGQPQTPQPPLYQKQQPEAITGPDVDSPPELAKQVMTVFTKYGCVSCHGSGSGNPAGGLRLVVPSAQGDALAKLSPDKRWKAYGMCSAGVMPPAAAKDAAKAVTQDDMVPLLQWAVRK